MLAGFLDESRRAGRETTHRYVLRLGNSRYPFMKLVLQENLLEDEFVLAVDTHDEMEIQPSFPDYEEWQELKRFNAALRARIEARWREERLDTCAELRRRAGEIAAAHAAVAKGRRALVVDDEPELAEAAACLLRGAGYEVETAFNGRQALEKIAARRPDIVLLDYEMPELDGLQVIESLRRDPTTRELPVLLTSASQMSLSQMLRASGFLAKPFPSEVLVSLFEHLLSGDGARGRS
jgi:CheY-like chemotaxis protein